MPATNNSIDMVSFDILNFYETCINAEEIELIEELERLKFFMKRSLHFSAN